MYEQCCLGNLLKEKEERTLDLEIWALGPALGLTIFGGDVLELAGTGHLEDSQES